MAILFFGDSRFYIGLRIKMATKKRHGSAWRFQICPVLFNSLGFPFCSKLVIFFFYEYENAIKGYYYR